MAGIQRKQTPKDTQQGKGKNQTFTVSPKAKLPDTVRDGYSVTSTKQSRIDQGPGFRNGKPIDQQGNPIKKMTPEEARRAALMRSAKFGK